MVIKLMGCTYKITNIVAVNIPRLPHLVPIYSSRHFTLLNSHCLKSSIFKSIDINVNIRNERKNVEKKWGSTSKITPISSFNCSRQLILVSN